MQDTYIFDVCILELGLPLLYDTFHTNKFCSVFNYGRPFFSFYDFRMTAILSCSMQIIEMMVQVRE